MPSLCMGHRHPCMLGHRHPCMSADLQANRVHDVGVYFAFCAQPHPRLDDHQTGIFSPHTCVVHQCDAGASVMRVRHNIKVVIMSTSGGGLNSALQSIHLIMV